MLTPLAAATIANAANDDVQPRVDGDGADERHRDPGDLVGLWIWHAATTATTVCQRSFWRARIPSPVRALR